MMGCSSGVAGARLIQACYSSLVAVTQDCKEENVDDGISDHSGSCSVYRTFRIGKAFPFPFLRFQGKAQK
jgi:hypothetical protein